MHAEARKYPIRSVMHHQAGRPMRRRGPLAGGAGLLTSTTEPVATDSTTAGLLTAGAASVSADAAG